MANIYENYIQDESKLLEYMSYIQIGVAVVVCLLLQCINSPYGRHGSSFWGPPVPAKLAWVVQELPSLSVPVWLILSQDAPKLDDLTNCVLLGLFLMHYTQRALIYPFLMRGGKPTPLLPFVLAFMFCCYNGYLQGRYLTTYGSYSNGWLQNISVRIGIGMFLIGMFINIHSDHILRNLRKPGEKDYKIPKGGMFEFVSGANFLGEIVEWFGFFVACQSLPALAFFVFTAANIGPRAVTHHKWYKEKFRDTYPPSRKAIIPFIL